MLGLRFCARAFSSCGKWGATLHRGARASHYLCCGAQAPDAQAQQLWLTGLVVPWPVGSSQTRARTHIPCIGRQTLNHCAAREAQYMLFRESCIHLFHTHKNPGSGFSYSQFTEEEAEAQRGERTCPKLPSLKGLFPHR